MLVGFVSVDISKVVIDCGCVCLDELFNSVAYDWFFCGLFPCVTF